MKVYRIAAIFILILATKVFAADPVKFEKTKIQIGTEILEVELAESPQQHMQGLMFRKHLDDGNGMLFVFNDIMVRRFWMKNTFVPLSIAYFGPDKTILNILDMKPVESEIENDLPTYSSTAPAQYALEVPRGWFKKHKIKVGNKFKFLSPTFKSK